jgi:hypothetical protein
LAIFDPSTKKNQIVGILTERRREGQKKKLRKKLRKLKKEIKQKRI